MGFENGNLFVTAGAFADSRHGFFFPATPPSPAIRLLPGPMDTIIAGFANGRVGIWNLQDGASLEQTRLHSAAIHMLIEGTRLFVASELGDHRVLDLAVFHTPYCDLLRRIWKEVPVVWEGGRSRLRAPPGDHGCSPH